MLHVDDELPFYVNGTLSQDDRARIQGHLARCSQCREALAFWQSLSSVMVETREALEQEAAERAPSLPHLPAVPSYRRAPVRRALNLFAAQWRLIRWQAALASGIILLGGLLALPAIRSQGSVGAVEFLRWLAPLATALGVSLLYSPAEREMAELLGTLPTSTRTVLLARLSLLYGGNAAVIGLLALCLGPYGIPVATLATGWLIPMALLSSLALLVAVLTDAIVATGVSSGLWALLGFSQHASAEANTWLHSLLSLINKPEVAVPLVVLQLAMALWFAGRPNVTRYRPAS